VAVAALSLVAAAARAVLLLSLPAIADQIARRELGYRASVDEASLDLLRGRIVLHGVTLRPIEGGPAEATADRIDVELLPRKGLFFGELSLDGVELKLVRTRDGTFTIGHRIAAAQRKSRGGRRGEPRPTPFPFRIDRGRVSRLAVTYDDRSFDPPVHVSANLDAQVDGLGTVDDDGRTPARTHLVLAGSIAGGRVVIDARGSAFTPDVVGRVTLEAVDIRPVAQALGLALPPAPEVSATAMVSIANRKSGPSSSFSLSLDDISVVASGTRVLQADHLAFRSTGPRGGPRSLEAEAARARVAVRIASDRTVEVLGLAIAPHEPRPRPSVEWPTIDEAIAALDGPREAPGAHEAFAAILGSPLLPERSALEHVRVSDLGVELVDESITPPAKLALVNGNVDLDRPRTEGETRPFSLSLDASLPGLAGSVALRAGGAWGPLDAGTFSAAIDATGLDGSAAEPWLARTGNGLVIAGHRLSARVTGALVRRERGWAGSAVIEGAKVGKEETIFGLDRLALEEAALDLSLARPRFTVYRATSHGIKVALLRRADHAVILGGLILRPPDGVPRSPRKPSREPPFDLRLDTLEGDGDFVFDDEVSGASIHAHGTAVANGFALGLDPPPFPVRAVATGPGIALWGRVEGVVRLSLGVPAVRVSCIARDIEPDFIDAYMRSTSTKLSPRPGSTLEGVFTFASRPRRELDGREGLMRLENVRLARGDEELLSADLAEARASRIDLRERLLELEQIELRRPLITVETWPGGRFAGLFIPRTTGYLLHEPHPLARPSRAIEIAIERGLVDQAELVLKPPSGVPVDVRDGRARAGPFVLRHDGTIDSTPIETTFSVADIASFVLVTGSVSNGPEGVRLRAALEGTSIAPGPLVERFGGPFEGGEPIERVRAELVVQVRRLPDDALEGEAVLRDVVLEQKGREPDSVGEVRARLARYDPYSKSARFTALEVDRPRLRADRDADARFRLLGLRTRERHDALTESASHIRKPRPRREREPGAGSVVFDRITVDEGRARFEDHAVSPLVVIDANRVEGRLDGLTIGRDTWWTPSTRVRLEADARDGRGAPLFKGTLDGTFARRPAVDAKLELSVHGLALVPFAPYALNAAGLALERGTVDVNAHADVISDRLEGAADFRGRDLRIVRASKSRVREQIERTGARIAIEALTDVEGETAITIPFEGDLSDPKFNTAALVGNTFWAAFLHVAGQPVKLLVWPLEFLGLGRIWRRPPPPPPSFEALFAPGDARLSDSARKVIQQVVDEVEDRAIALRAEVGTGDRSRATRLASTDRRDLRDLADALLHDESSRRAARRELVAAAAAALERGDERASFEARARLRALDDDLARDERALADLARRAEDPPEAFASREHEALTQLTEARLEAVKHELIAAGVPPQRIRIRPTRLRPTGATEALPGGMGRVLMVVGP
jgi:hypothetical protein